MSKYKEHLAIFFDVLGFKQIVEGGNFSSEDVLLMLRQLRLLSQDSGVNMNFISFSDSIVQAIELERKLPSEPMYLLGNVINEIARVQTNMISTSKTLIRGGISVGKLFFEQDIIFGEAMNKSYELESKFAVYPRIILHPNVFDAFQTKVEDFLHILSIDSDGLPFVDYLKWSTSNYMDDYNGFVEFHKRFILDKVKKVREGLNPVSIKYSWLIQKHNQCVENLSEKKTRLSELKIDESIMFDIMKQK